MRAREHAEGALRRRVELRLLNYSRGDLVLRVEPSLCKGCMLCVEACPQGVLEESPSRVNSRGYALPEPLRLDKCTGCRLCEMLCPDFAIEVDASGGAR